MQSILIAICLFITVVSGTNIEKSILSEEQLKRVIEWYNSPSRERDIESFKDWQTDTKSAEYFLIVSVKNIGYSIDVSIQPLESKNEEYYITVNAGTVRDETNVVGSVLGVTTVLTKFAEWEVKFLILIVNERIWGVQRDALLRMYDMFISNKEMDSLFISRNLQLISDLTSSPHEEYSSESNVYRNKQYGFAVIFPDGWLVGPGNTPHTVIRADSRLGGEEREHINIQVHKKPPEPKYLDIDDMADVITDMINPQNQTLLGSGYTKLGGQKAFYFKTVTSMSDQYSVMRQTMLFRDGYVYMVSGGVFGKTPQNVSGRFAAFEPILDDVLASFQLEGNTKSEYDTHDVSGKEETPGFENTLLGGILISMVVTWIIGLAPPLMLRYVFIRKPVKKKNAIVTVVILGMANLAIFMLMGSQSKTHAVLLIIAIISYWILVHGYSKET